MFADRIEGKWIDAFCEVFARCAVKAGDTAAILSETQSRALNVHLAELALLRLGARPFHLVVPTPRNRHPVPVRSAGASALQSCSTQGKATPVRTSCNGSSRPSQTKALRRIGCRSSTWHQAAWNAEVERPRGIWNANCSTYTPEVGSRRV